MKIKNNVKDIEDIKKFNFRYTSGYMMNSDTSYEITCDDKCILELKPIYVAEEDKLSIELTKEEIDSLIKIINDNKVTKWDGFHKSDKYVLDGDTFSLTIYTKDDREISASGYMMYPKNYSSFRTSVDSLFEKYIPEEMKKF